MRMYLKILGMVLVFSFFVLSSVSDAVNLKKAIIGKWFEEGGNDQYEFLKDGTVIIVKVVSFEGKKSFTGDYKFIDDNRLRIDTKIGAMVFEVSIDKEGKLILKEPTGKVTTYLTEKAYQVKFEAQRKAEEERRKTNGHYIVVRWQSKEQKLKRASDIASHLNDVLKKHKDIYYGIYEDIDSNIIVLQFTLLDDQLFNEVLTEFGKNAEIHILENRTINGDIGFQFTSSGLFVQLLLKSELVKFLVEIYI